MEPGRAGRCHGTHNMDLRETIRQVGPRERCCGRRPAEIPGNPKGIHRSGFPRWPHGLHQQEGCHEAEPVAKGSASGCRLHTAHRPHADGCPLHVGRHIAQGSGLQRVCAHSPLPARHHHTAQCIAAGAGGRAHQDCRRLLQPAARRPALLRLKECRRECQARGACGLQPGRQAVYTLIGPRAHRQFRPCRPGL